MNHRDPPASTSSSVAKSTRLQILEKTDGLRARSVEVAAAGENYIRTEARVINHITHNYNQWDPRACSCHSEREKELEEQLKEMTETMDSLRRNIEQREKRVAQKEEWVARKREELREQAEQLALLRAEVEGREEGRKAGLQEGREAAFRKREEDLESREYDLATRERRLEQWERDLTRRDQEESQSPSPSPPVPTPSRQSNIRPPYHPGAVLGSAPSPPPSRHRPRAPAHPRQSEGVTAVALRDYKAVDDDEISLFEGERITQIEFISGGIDWWRGKNSRGKVGLFRADSATTTL